VRDITIPYRTNPLPHPASKPGYFPQNHREYGDRPVDAVEPIQSSENEGGLGLLLDLQVRPVGVGPRRELGRVPEEPTRILAWLGPETRHGSEPQYGRNRSDLLRPHVFPHDANINLGGGTSQAVRDLLTRKAVSCSPPFAFPSSGRQL
jgi:hypothetical protein